MQANEAGRDKGSTSGRSGLVPRVVAALAALAIGWLAPAMAQTPIPLPVTPVSVLINSSPGQQVDPHVDGDIASYSDFGLPTFANPAPQVRYYDFRTGADNAIPNGGNYDQLSRVSAGRIVFTRIFPDGSQAVMLFDTSSGGAPVEVNPVANSQRGAAAIGGNTIAYVDYDLPGGSMGEIVVWDLAGGFATRVTNDGNIDQNPTVSPDGNVVVWERCPPTSLSNCDIAMAVKSSTGWTVNDVSATAAPEGFPDTNGTVVVWTAHNGTDYDIYWRPVVGGAVQQLALPGDQVHSSIAGDVIAFEGVSGGGTDIFVYHLLDGALYQLTNTPGIQESLNDLTVLPGHMIRVVWQANDGADGMNDIHAATFPIPHNTKPIADAGLDQGVIRLGTLVRLDGSTSWDPEGDPLTYLWTMVSRPAGSQAALSDRVSPTPTFVADVQGVYDFTLVVNDGQADSDPDSVMVSFANVVPVANAGGNQAVFVGNFVTLDGRASSDANGDPLTYAWRFDSVPAGSLAALNSPTSAVAGFTPDRAGNYLVSLVVNDGFANSPPSTATITATAIGQPYQSAVDKLQDLIATVNALGNASFRNAQMRNTLTKKINEVIALLQAGAYADALSKLLNDIAPKTDGCALGGSPDQTDWIRDCASQAQLAQQIQDAIVLIRQLMGP